MVKVSIILVHIAKRTYAKYIHIVKGLELLEF